LILWRQGQDPALRFIILKTNEDYQKILEVTIEI